jgi:hypothetical protein
VYQLVGCHVHQQFETPHEVDPQDGEAYFGPDERPAVAVAAHVYSCLVDAPAFDELPAG